MTSTTLANTFEEYQSRQGWYISQWLTAFKNNPTKHHNSIKKLIWQPDDNTAPVLPAPSSETHDVYCYECGKAFKDIPSLKKHAFREHSQINPMRLYLRHTTCESCKWQHHTHRRLLRHVTKSKKCQQYYLENITPMERQSQEFHEICLLTQTFQRTNKSAGYIAHKAHIPAYYNP